MSPRTGRIFSTPCFALHHTWYRWGREPDFQDIYSPTEVVVSAAYGFPVPHWLRLLPLSLGVSEWAPHPMAHIRFPKWRHMA
ncbi:rCG43225, partial [Rattus norvegicus]